MFHVEHFENWAIVWQRMESNNCLFSDLFSIIGDIPEWVKGWNGDLETLLTFQLDDYRQAISEQLYVFFRGSNFLSTKVAPGYSWYNFINGEGGYYLDAVGITRWMSTWNNNKYFRARELCNGYQFGFLSEAEQTRYWLANTAVLADKSLEYTGAPDTVGSYKKICWFRECINLNQSLEGPGQWAWMGGVYGPVPVTPEQIWLSARFFLLLSIRTRCNVNAAILFDSWSKFN
jgi:hypothetical protein